MMRRAATWVVTATVLGALATSCSTGASRVATSDASSPTRPSAATSSASATTGAASGETTVMRTAPATTGTTTAAQTTPSASSITVADLFLPYPAAGLDALTSYHQVMTLTVRGGAMDTVNSYTRDAWRLTGTSTVITTTDPSGTTELLIGDIGRSSYVRPASGARCEVRWRLTDAVPVPAIEPADLLPPVIAATEAGTADHDGRAVIRYTFESRIGAATGTGELLLARDSHLLVSYTLDLVAGAVTSSYRYDLTAIDALGQPRLPDGCAAVLEAVPTVDGAANVQRLPGALDYSTTSSVPDVIAFYAQAMPALGWTLVGTRDDDPARNIIVFTRAATGQTVSILVEATGGATWVSAIVRSTPAPG